MEDPWLFRVIGQPNLNFTVNGARAARYQVNVADVQDAIQTAVGGNALTQVLKGEQRSQRPLAIVIVGGLISGLVMSIFLLPTLYVWVARPGDVLPAPEVSFEE